MKLNPNVYSTIVSQCIELLVGIDGLPLFKSGMGEFWPILISIANIPILLTHVIPVGIYYGVKKLDSNCTFLSAFVEDIIHTMETGIVLNGKRFFVKIKGFCCDAPAKAFILGIKGHTGYSSCTKCKQGGRYFANRMTFPDIPNKIDLVGMLRTSEGFLSKEDPEFHNTDTILTNIPALNFISAFPLDYMHLVCLRVTRTILYIWMFARPPLKFSYHLISEMSLNLSLLKSSIPSEFSRKPRGLEEVKRWKATELRQFLLYTGPVVLKNILVPDYEKVYDSFLHLHISMRILLDPKLCFQHREYADSLLSRFLKVFKNLYGPQYMTHNFHNLLHLSGDVLTFGPLDACSAFKFENYLHSLKNLIRKGEKPLAQVVKRLLERFDFVPPNTVMPENISYPYYSSTHELGPLISDCDVSKQYKKVHFQSFTLSTDTPNSCCSLKDGSVVVIYNIIYYLTFQTMCLIFLRFETYEEFFGPPLIPSSSLRIHLVSKLSKTLEIAPISQILEKNVLLPVGNGKKLALPLLHTV